MLKPEPAALLHADEPLPWECLRADGASPWVLLCDHAGQRLPRRLGNLGLKEGDRARHIAWDIGAGDVTRRLSEALDACALLQPYSRLVIDCNRPLHAPDSIVTRSETTEIPGNHALTAAQVAARQRDIFMPYHAHIRALLDARLRRSQPTLLLSVHSFTPVFLGEARPWHVGLLYGRDARLAQALHRELQGEPALCIGLNEPYRFGEESDYTLSEHAQTRGLAHLELEIRQDLIADEQGRRQWAQQLARMLLGVSDRFAAPPLTTP